MQEITQLRRGLAFAAGQGDVAIDMQVAEWKRRAIQRSLYGVDINTPRWKSANYACGSP